MTTWSDVWNRWLRVIELRYPTAAIDHSQPGCCEAHILYGKPGTEVPTGLMSGSSATTATNATNATESDAAPRRTSSRKGRRHP